MGYCVRYGFGKDQDKLREVFLNTRDTKDNNDIFIYQYVCFASYWHHRTSHRTFHTSPVYYSLSCNKDLLEKLIEYINALGGGINVSLEKSELLYKLVTYKREYNKEDKVYKTVYHDYDHGGSTTKVTENIPDNLKTYDVSRCAVKISIKTRSFKARLMLEFITLVFLRLLDINENYYNHIPVNTTDPVRDAIKASNKMDDGHSLYDKTRYLHGRRIINEFTVDHLSYCLNVKNATKAVRGYNMDNSITQSPIIDLIYKTKE